MRGITKTFPGVKALNNVSLTVEAGKVLALVGENGAGKSTLMKILSGIYKRDAGDIFIEGQPVEIDGPLSSRALGISIIYQELSVLNNMDIAENIFVGREMRKNGLVDHRRQHEKARKLLQHVGLEVDTRTKVKMLSTAQKQMVEVAKALSYNAKLIIMDEPTSSLTDTETATLMDIIRRLRSEGVAIVYISHRMNEIFEISDEIAVMRDGEMLDKVLTSQTNEGEIIAAMVGRDVKNLFVKEPAPIGDTVLEVKGLSTKNFLKDISFTVRAGEIVGFAGLVGAGRSEVMRAVFGIDRRESGDIYVRGEKVSIRNTVDALKCGMGFVPEDRKEQALILKMSVEENTSLAALRSVSKNWFIRPAQEKALAEEYVQKLKVKTPSLAQKVLNLSGGNQQKVVIAKWMATHPTILILDEPTRGIDVGAKKEIHALMSQMAQEGVAIIMISSELPEVLGMSDRIYVMHEGRLKGQIKREDASQEIIMKMAIS
ncbi:MAG TPA: sugar ABC transporter ATP-binding protein [Candidatus Pullichristensenella avicola]|nr:sugar ABC transporter ATP-binding protein [Candidatus Pullichristensenella avicola]